MPTTRNSDGTAGNINSLITASSPGDTVTIPGGSYVWNQTVSVPGKNIRLIGLTGTIASGTLPHIEAAPGIDILIHYTCEDSSRFTAEIGNLELYGELGSKLKIDGVATITQSGGVYSGGMVLHDIRFTNSLTSTANVAGHHFLMTGWVFGVMYHCEVLESLTRFGFETMLLNHDTGPLDTGSNGDTSYFQALGGSDLAGRLDLFTIEDCIFRHTGATFDSGGGTGGGGRYCARHNTNWAPWATHGTRESGGGGRGVRILEIYNNHCIRNSTTYQSQHRDVGEIEARDGEMVIYNNFTTGQTGSTLESGIQVCVGMSCYGVGTVSDTGRFAYGADGLNPWDRNAKANPVTGIWIDPNNGNSHHVLSGYNHPQSDPLGLQFTAGADQVTSGFDTEPRFSDVFGTVAPGSFSGLVLTNCVVTATGKNPSDSIDGYFDGFVLRNAEVSRTLGLPTDATICFMYCVHSSGTFSNASFQFAGSDQAYGGHPKLNLSGTHLELRRIQEYFGVAGTGWQDVAFQPDSDPAILISGSPNPRWVSTIPGGIYLVGNRKRVGTGSFGAEIDVNKVEGTPAPGTFRAEIKYVVRDFHHLKNQASTYPAGTSGLKVGYPWDSTVSSAGNNRVCRVGADWTNDYVTGVALGISTPEFASFYMDGAVMSTANPYPHVLRQAPSGVAPSFTDGATVTANFAPGVAETYTVKTSAIPTATITISAGSLPANVTFTDLGDGTATITGNTSTVAGSATVTIHATNASGSANESFTLVIDSPSVSLTKPLDGQVFSHDAGVDAVINLAADATALSGINKVEFYAGTNLLNTTTTTPYSFVWSGMADGTYVVKARAYDAGLDFNDSLTATVTVSTNAVVLPDAPTTINVTG